MTGPLLIGGCARSGTTALAMLLNSDPRVFVTNEENLLQVYGRVADAVSTRERLRRKAEDASGRPYADAETGLMREASVREPHTLADLHAYNFTAEGLHDAVYALYTAFHRRLGTPAAMEVWGDKWPLYWRQGARIFDLPGARYVHITRNPHDVVNSMLRRHAAARQGRDWWMAFNGVDRMIEEWRLALSVAHGFAREVSAERFLHVRYEDLVFDREAVLSRLSAFCGLEMKCGYALVDDPAKHFDRAHMTPEIAKDVERQTGVPATARQDWKEAA